MIILMKNYFQKKYSSGLRNYLEEKVNVIGYENQPIFEGKLQEKLNFSKNVQSKLEIINASDLKPLELGDLCICFLRVDGFYNQNCIFAITEVNESSTKTPVNE